MTRATSQSPSSLRKKVGPSIWLLRVCARFASLLLLLLIPATTKAQNHPAAQCHAANTNTCTIGSAIAQSTIVVRSTTGAGLSCTTPTDTFTLTWTQIRDTSFTDSFGTRHICSYYARTGANSGSEAITTNGTASADGSWVLAEDWSASDITPTGNPVDQQCGCDTGHATCGSANIPTGSSSVNSCAISSTRTNDIFLYSTYASIAGSCSFEAVSPPSNGPTLTAYTAAGCTFLMTNANLAANPVTLIPSGPPLASTTINFPTNNTGGSPGFFAAQLITFFPGLSGGAAKRRLPPQIIKWHPPKSARTIRVSLEDYR